MGKKGKVFEHTTSLLFSHYITRKEHIYPDIFEIYAKKEIDYYKLYKSIGIDLLHGNYAYTFERMLSFQKVFCIFSYAEENSEYDQVYALIRKGYKKVWDYFKHHRDVFDGEDFSEHLAKTNKNMNLTNSFFAEHYFIARTMAEIKGMDIEDNEELFKLSVDIGEASVIPYAENAENETASNASKQNRRLLNESETLPQFIPLLKSLMKEKTVYDGVYSYLIKATESEIKKEEHRLKKLSLQKKQPFHVKVMNLDDKPNFDCYCPACRTEKLKDKQNELIKENMKNSFLQYYFVIGEIFQSVNIDVMNFMHYLSIDKEDVEPLMDALEEVGGFEYNEEMKECLFFVALYASIIKKEYSKLRDYAFNQKKEDLMLQVQQYKEQYEAIHRETQSGMEQARIKEKGYLQRINALNEEIEFLQSKNRQMQQSLDKTEKNNKEVKALRQFLMQSDQEDHSEVVDHTASYIRELSKRKILVIGGHHRWQQRMKDLIPTLTLIYTDEAIKGIANVEQYDAVFINSTVMSHGAYYRIIPSLEKTSVPFYFLSGVVNKHRNVVEMYELLTGVLVNQYMKQKGVEI